jgi:iron complex outermembrane receptor protein
VSAATAVVRNPSDDYRAFNPRVGAIRGVGEETELYTSLSRLFEAPTNYELQDDVRGSDATLAPMRGTVGEVGIRGDSTTQAARWHWDVAAYYAQIHDEILSIDDPRAPGTSLTTNIDRTRHAGVEGIVGASFVLGDDGHRLEPLLSATINDFAFRSDPVYGDRRLPAAPRYFARGEMLYRHPGGFHAGPTFDLVGARHADFANSYRVGAYGLIGARTGFDGEHWQVFGEVRNLLDRETIATLSVVDRAGPDARVLNPGAPRSLYVGARLTR